MKHEELKSKLLKSSRLVDEYYQRDFAYEIGRKIKEIRIKNGLTQLELATKIKTKQSSIARLESGSAGLPSLSFLKKIADATGYYLETPKFLEVTNFKAII